jgi:hypothetical protein
MSLAPDHLRILLVPGGGGSGPDHWHSHWEALHPRVERVVQRDWEAGTREDWVATLDRFLQDDARPTIVVPHSLGCLTVAEWAARDGGASGAPIVGALMVGPADVDADWADTAEERGPLYRSFRPVPMQDLPFPSLLVASTDDPLLSLARAQALAEAWGSELHTVGALQHIGSESLLGDWPQGRALLQLLIARVAA